MGVVATLSSESTTVNISKADIRHMSSTAPTDGRRIRRERGRLAAIDAAIDLNFETGQVATPEAIVERAKISMASLFRYFETLDEIQEMAAERYFTRFAHLFEIPNIGVGALPQRIRTFVKARADQHIATEPIARTVRTKGIAHAPISEALIRIRVTQADQVKLHFMDELDHLTRGAADDTAATIAVLTSFESWDQFRSVSQRSNTQIVRAWATTLEAIITRGTKQGDSTT